MANYNDLKTSIKNVIRTNGNNEITGQILQYKLIEMIDSLGSGYQFAGVATPSTVPGTPDQKVFYLAGAGEYVNFNNAEIQNSKIGVLYYDNTWHVSTLDLPPTVRVDGDKLKIDDEIVGEILFVGDRERILLQKVDAEVSVNLFNKDSDKIILGKYFYHKIVENNTNCNITHPIKVFKGITYKYIHNQFLGGNRSVAICDADGNIIDSFDGKIDGDFNAFTPTEDCYVLINMGNAKSANFMVCVASMYPETYVGFVKNIGADYGLGDKQVEQIREMYPISVKKQKSVNLYDKNNPLCKLGYYSSGTFVQSNSYKVTHPIFVEQGVTYKAHYNSSVLGSTNNVVCVVDAQNNILSEIKGEISGSTISFTPDINCFVSLNVGSVSSDDNKMMVCELSEYPETYKPFYQYTELSGLMIPNENIESVLFRKSVIFTGDSICAGATDDQGQSGWASRIGNKNSMVWQNKAVSGGTIMEKSLIGSSFTICDTDFGDGADYIILEGGVNDADRIGSILSGGNPQYYGEWGLTDYKTQFANSTFCSAFERMIQRVVTAFPTSKVGYIVVPKMGVTSKGYDKEHNNRRAYFETAIQICKKWGVPVLNLWDECPMNPSISSHYSGTSTDNNGLYLDGSHPTAKGYEVLSPIVEEWMKTL